MNILLMDGLPNEYEGIPISTDFRNMINVDLIMNDDDLNDHEKLIAALTQLYPEIPGDIETAVKGLSWFFSGGIEAEQGGGSGKRIARAFDFDQDANMIYAAFYATYGISLTTIKYMHWWEFKALFEGLPEDTQIKKVMYYRTADTSEVSKTEKTHIEKMRKLFKLKETKMPAMDAETLKQQTKERVERRFREAQASLNK